MIRPKADVKCLRTGSQPDFIPTEVWQAGQAESVYPDLVLEPLKGRSNGT